MSSSSKFLDLNQSQLNRNPINRVEHGGTRKAARGLRTPGARRRRQGGVVGAVAGCGDGESRSNLDAQSLAARGLPGPEGCKVQSFP